MAHEMTTVSGERFDPLQPDMKKVHLEDIAHALSLLCRGGGHVKHFHSVAQHCLECADEARARGLSTRVQLACLLHDASEAYMGDLITPIKEQTQAYKNAEDALLNQIWTKYLGSSLTKEEEMLVFEVDKDFLSYEFHTLMPHDIGDRYLKVRTTPTMDYADPAAVKQQYLDLATLLISQL